MSGWVAGGIVVGAGISSYASSRASKKAASATKEAAQTAAGAEQQSLDYLKEINKLPQQYKEEALKRLAGLQGLEGGVGTQQDLIDRAISSPLYQQMMGGQEAGEEGILRSAAATGGLRSGNVQASLYDYNTQLQNQALLESYNQQLRGLSGLAGTPTNEMAISSGISGVGRTQAQGQVAVGQIQQQGIQQQGDIWSSAVGGLSKMYSDRRLKKNLKKIGRVKGFNWYEWDWNIVANKMGLNGSCSGVLADEIYDSNPECILIMNCFMAVNYGKLLGAQNE